jgi:hypothetical protein
MSTTETPGRGPSGASPDPGGDANPPVPAPAPADTTTGDLAPPRSPGRVRHLGRHLGRQGVRVLLLAAVVVLSGIALGWAVAFPLRYVDYEASDAVNLDQAALAGTVAVEDALVAPADLPPGWQAGDAGLGAFGVLGADVCGVPVETPTPLSGKEVAVFTDPTDRTSLIAQALRVDQSKSAVGYIDDVADELDGCDTFFRVDGDRRIEVTSTEPDRDPPVTDHITRTYQSPEGVQEWSMMAVGDVIVAVQYVGPTRPNDTFLDSVERSVLARIVPSQFSPTSPGAVTVPAEGSGGDGTGDEPVATTTPPTDGGTDGGTDAGTDAGTDGGP